MKKIQILIYLILMASTTISQGINQEKMNRDLEVAETILKGLVDTKQNQVFWLGKEREIIAEYIEGYGVIMILPVEKNAFQFNMAKVYRKWPEVSDAINYAIEDLETDNFTNYYYHVDTANNDDKDLNAVLKNHRKEMESQQKHMEARQRDLEARQHDIEQRARSFALRTLKSLNTDSVNRANFDRNLENIKIFLLDYGHIISQLKDEDKIKIISKGQDNQYYRTDDGRMEYSNNFNEFSAEIQMKDVRSYQNGKLSREEAENRIKINNKTEEKPLAKDIAVFKSIINRLYESDLSETFYLKSDINHEEIEGLGTILYLNMASSRKTDTYYIMPTQGNQQYSQVDRAEKIKALYPQFEEELIAQIFEYGKNITSLGDDAKLIFKIKNTECAGCSIPENFEILINGKTLKALKSGKMDEKEARKEIRIIQGRMQ